MAAHDIGPLRQVLIDAADKEGCSLTDLTVLAVQNDPYRVDTEAGHRDGAWLASVARDLGLGNRTIHLRGLHYMVLGQSKPDGLPYTNTEKDWLWLSSQAGKAARWLGYLPFEQIVDQRNAAPTIRLFKPSEPRSYINVGIDIEIPEVDDLEPQVRINGFVGVQPYKLVFFGEKSSLEPVLGPIADRHQADLYLPTGEISDTLMYQMARTGSEDGRPMIVFCFSDCDPAGWQMPISIARKLQAFASLGVSAPEFQVRRVALTPEHVHAHGLPSTPLKATEKRGDNWRTQMGIEQTEIDALATLQPDLLRDIANDAVAPFYDATLDRRVRQARTEWIAAAQTIVDAATDPETMERIRADAAEKLTAMQSEIQRLNDALQIDIDDLDLPTVEIPEPELPDEPDGLPLLDSGWSFADQTRSLIASKEYREDNE